MPVLDRDTFFNRLHERLGSDSSEESISFLEDMTDTYNDLERRANGDGTDWEKKYHELDENWRKRYRHRFFTGDGGNAPEEEKEADGYEAEDVTVEDLFEEKKK